MTLHFWVFSVFTKLAPCILLTYLSLTLIKALIEADKRKKRLKSRPVPSQAATVIIAQPVRQTTAQLYQSPPQPIQSPSTQPPTVTLQAAQPEMSFSSSQPKSDQSNQIELADQAESADQKLAPMKEESVPSSVTVIVGSNGTNPPKAQTYKSTLGVHSSFRGGSSSSDQLSDRPSHDSSQHFKAERAQKEPHDSKSSQNDRTNRMLIAVLLLFLITEFPSGILVLLSGIIGDTFFRDVYSPLGELMDILALVNSSINFILYCSMSSVFRATFINIFCKCFTRGNDLNFDNEMRPIKGKGEIRNTVIKINTPNNNRKGSNVNCTKQEGQQNQVTSL